MQHTISITQATAHRLCQVLRPFTVRSDAPLLNDAVRALPRVRLISELGDDCGLMSGEEALRRAKHSDKDLMQVSRSQTPVVRLLDYARYQESRRKKEYERRKASKESARLQKKESAIKQIRLSPSTDTNDTMIKMRKARDFLFDGYKVKIYIQFRRGQGRLSENARSSLVTAAEHLSQFGNIQGVPSTGLKDLCKTNDEEEQTKRRPMQILIQPLARSKREELLKETDEIAELK